MTRRALMRALHDRWAHRPRINMSPPQMPTWFLVLFGGFAAVMTTWLAWALGRVVPSYFEAAAEAKELGVIGIALGAAILVVAAFAWAYAEIAAVCRTELR